VCVTLFSGKAKGDSSGCKTAEAMQ